MEVEVEQNRQLGKRHWEKDLVNNKGDIINQYGKN